MDSSPVAITQVPSELDAASDLDHSASGRHSSVVSSLARSSNHRPAAAGEGRNKTNSQLDVHPATELAGSGVEANEHDMTLRNSEGVQAETAHQDQVTREDASEDVEVSKQCQSWRGGTQQRRRRRCGGKERGKSVVCNEAAV